MEPIKTETKNFFISYNKADKAWAVWVAWQLEENGYTTVNQAWDFKPGNNFVLKMAKAAEAERTIAILSNDYIKSEFTQSEWAAAFAQDPMGEKGILIPIRVNKCDLPNFLKPIVYIDLVNKDEENALQDLLQQIKTERAKPKNSPEFPGKKLQPEFPGISSNTVASKQRLDNKSEEIVTTENIVDLLQLDKHIEFQNKIKLELEEELSTDVLKPLREAFVEVIWKKSGKKGNPSNSQLVNELFSIDPATQCANSEVMLEKLINGTGKCLKQLNVIDQSISENHIVWKSAKQMLGWLVTLSVRAETVNQGNNVPFDETEMETLMGVEVYTARQKSVPATFIRDNREKNADDFCGDNQIDHEFFPEAGWQTDDIIEQIWLIVWRATGGKPRTSPLSKIELKKLNKRLELHRTGDKKRNYHIVVSKLENHPLLLPEICKQIKAELSGLTIVHVGAKTGEGTLLLIGEGEMVALIEEFLNLIEQYQ